MTAGTQQAVVELLREVTGEDDEWVAGITAETRLDGDLFLDSLELLALSRRLAEHFGSGVDLAAHVAGLELADLLTLNVAAVSSYVDSVAGSGGTL